MSIGTEEPTTEQAPSAPVEAPATAGPTKAPVRLGDRIFSSLSIGSGVLILVVLVLVALFLFREALPYFTSSDTIEREVPFPEYVLPLVFGTVYAATLALFFAVVPAVAA